MAINVSQTVTGLYWWKDSCFCSKTTTFLEFSCIRTKEWEVEGGLSDNLSQNILRRFYILGYSPFNRNETEADNYHYTHKYDQRRRILGNEETSEKIGLKILWKGFFEKTNFTS